MAIAGGTTNTMPERHSDALRKSVPIYVWAYPYQPLSGGGRSLHLLVKHLNRCGYEAFILGTFTDFNSNPLTLPCADSTSLKEHRHAGREPVIVYPEVVPGNPLQCECVVRYLLNRPGLFEPGIEETFEDSDLFLHYAPEHVPKDRCSFDMFVPLVDHSIYSNGYPSDRRNGFVAYIHRVNVDLGSLPAWVHPVAVVTMQNPQPPERLADLYRTSRAAIFWERSSAIFEALSCGCPAIIIPSEFLNENTYQLRFRAAGMVWGWNEAALPRATEDTSIFRAIYRGLEENLDHRIYHAFDTIIGRALFARSRAEI
jgi:hypothetical protein